MMTDNIPTTLRFLLASRQCDLNSLGCLLDSGELVGKVSVLIHHLLSLVFAISDASVALAISQALIALFSFMQGKELAEQEKGDWSAYFQRAYAENDELSVLDSETSDASLFSRTWHPKYFFLSFYPTTTLSRER